MSVAHETLPLSIGELQRTRAPLERATPLPRAAFTDPRVLDWELEHVFMGGWICVGHVDQVRERGDYLMVELGGESVFVVADDDGLPRAFLNTCRHRGARLVEEPEGRLRRLQCPYHAWTYGFDGALRSAPFTDGLEDFDPRCFGLHAVRLAVVEGLVLLDLSGTAPPPDEHVGDLAPRWRATGSASCAARSGSSTTSTPTGRRSPRTTASACTARACTPSSTGSPTTSRARRSTGAGAWCGGSMTLRDGAETMAATGGARAARRSTGVTEDDQRSVLYFLLFPNTLVSLHPDYVMLHTLWPRAFDRTEVVCEWFFEPATMQAAGLRPVRRGRLLGPGQPRGLARLRAHAARHGLARLRARPLHDEEGDVHAFDVMVADRYLEALAGAVEVGS